MGQIKQILMQQKYPGYAVYSCFSYVFYLILAVVQMFQV